MACNDPLSLEQGVSVVALGLRWGLSQKLHTARANAHKHVHHTFGSISGGFTKVWTDIGGLLSNSVAARKSGWLVELEYDVLCVE